jgi:hypothetical protein
LVLLALMGNPVFLDNDTQAPNIPFEPDSDRRKSYIKPGMMACR